MLLWYFVLISPSFTFGDRIIELLGGGSSDDFSTDSFKKELLEEYNFYRELHESDPLELDDGLCHKAALWAEYLATAPSDKCLHHSLWGGENIYFFWSTKSINEKSINEKDLAKKACRAFYEEIKYYDYNNPGLVWPAAHFTEMIWKDVRKMGIGVFRRVYEDSHGACRIKGSPEQTATGYFVVIHHSPHGNIMSAKAFEENVNRPLRSLNFTETDEF